MRQSGTAFPMARAWLSPVIRSKRNEDRWYPSGMLSASYGDDNLASYWVYVRAPSGAEGWVAREYLDWY